MRVFAAGVVLAMSVAAQAGQSAPDDPYIWLEEQTSPRAIAWVEGQNAVTAARLERDPRFATFQAETLAIAGAKDRIPSPNFLNGAIYNFWQDEAHLRGIWRKTTLASYGTAAPAWTTVLDIDALGRSEGKSWVFKGASCRQPEQDRCLIALSLGGEDAVEYREFDLASGSFVSGGFYLPKSKSRVTWQDRDHLLVATELAPGDLTTSGYPYIVTRGASRWPRQSRSSAARSPTSRLRRRCSTIARVTRWRTSTAGSISSTRTPSSSPRAGSGNWRSRSAPRSRNCLRAR